MSKMYTARRLWIVWMRVSPYQAAEPLQPTGCGHGTAGAIRTI